VRKNLTKIESLDISMIAPQHGSIIQKEEVTKYIELLKNLGRGTDLQEAKRL
jgi:flavorubredoxin